MDPKGERCVSGSLIASILNASRYHRTAAGLFVYYCCLGLTVAILFCDWLHAAQVKSRMWNMRTPRGS